MKNNINDILYFNNPICSFSFDKLNNKKDICFKLSNLSYIFNFRFNIIQVEYNILFYYKNLSLITPSDLSLYYDLHLICHIKDVESNIIIDSLAFILINQYFQCIEFININEKINFGIIIYEQKNETSCLNFTHYFFNNNIFNYDKKFYQKNEFFHPLFQKKEFYLKNNNIYP